MKYGMHVIFHVTWKQLHVNGSLDTQFDGCIKRRSQRNTHFDSVFKKQAINNPRNIRFTDQEGAKCKPYMNGGIVIGKTIESLRPGNLRLGSLQEIDQEILDALAVV